MATPRTTTLIGKSSRRMRSPLTLHEQSVAFNFTTMARKKQSRQTELRASTADKSKYADVLSDIVMEGELQKRTRLMGWKKYRFVLRKNDLRRYSTKSFRERDESLSYKPRVLY